MRELLSKEEWTATKYSVGIAQTPREIDELYKLRYDVFNTELGEGIKENEATGRDIDKFDANCEHLIVKDKTNDNIIATYRIHPSWNIHKDGFYTSTEFDISSLKLDKRQAIEVGRACIQPEHRGNIILAVLWIAIREYCKENNVDALFGLASIPKCSVEEISSLYKHLFDKGFLVNDGTVTPLKDQRVKLISNPPETFRKEILGSLIKGYLKLGAKLMGEPAFDPIFGCYDFFVLLEMDKVNWNYVDSIAKILNLDPSDASS